MSTEATKTDEQRAQEAHELNVRCRDWNTESEKIWVLHRALTMDAGAAANEKLADIMGRPTDSSEFWTPDEKAKLKGLYYQKLTAL